MIQKADGDYDGALASLRTVEAKYPRDRVVLNQMARILFLKRQYKEALAVLERVGLVDPEDVQMHYTAMLCYRGLGDAAKAAREETLFRRFKADESSQAITDRAPPAEPRGQQRAPADPRSRERAAAEPATAAEGAAIAGGRITVGLRLSSPGEGTTRGACQGPPPGEASECMPERGLNTVRR